MSNNPQSQDKRISTGGGTSVGGNVDTDGGDFVGRDQFNIRNIFNVFSSDSGQARLLRHRHTMLTLVKNTWIKSVLEKSLHNVALIDLGLVENSAAVAHPWDMVLHTGNQPPKPLPAGTKIVDVFNDTSGSLLILGEPGAGKTTMLLELARSLIAHAEQDVTKPLPVVFNLSSWSEEHQNLGTWLIRELNTKYNIPLKLAQQWVNSDDLLLLLDGLDEVQQAQRKTCIQVINNHCRDRMIAIAICSRTTEYQLSKTQLQLRGAIVLQPLTDQQIDAYLDSSGEKLRVVRELLSQDATLKELAQSPLTLSIMSLAYQDKLAQNVQFFDSRDARRKHLFDAYINRMFTRPGRTDISIYERKQTLQWLAWLARQMTRRSQTIFLIEQLQRDWLEGKFAKQEYIATVKLIHGLIFILSSGLVSGVGIGLAYGSVDGLNSGLLTGLVFGLFSGMLSDAKDKIKPIEQFNWSLRSGLFYGFIYWLVFTLVFGSLGAVLGRLQGEPKVVIASGLGIGLICGVTSGLVGMIRGGMKDIPSLQDLKHSWKERFKFGLVYGWGDALGLGLSFGLICGLIFGVFYGLNNVFFGILSGICIGCLTSILMTLLSVGLMGKFKITEIPTKILPNQGIRRSIRNSITYGLSGGLIGMLGIELSIGISIGLIYSLNSELFWQLTGIFGFGIITIPNSEWRLLLTLLITTILILWLSVGLSIWDFAGGNASINHLGLRVMLYRKHLMPWNYANFLDYCHDRIFLRKVGGGYIFIHRLLMEHFASLTDEEIVRLTGSSAPSK